MEEITKTDSTIKTEANTKLAGLSEIANWQLNSEKAEVGLPALQRGYVWNTKQVETLWDSLLRGFPIGSFLVAANGTNKKDLLDGQQRATAIAMGYYNPWYENKNADFFSPKFKQDEIHKTVPVLWLDIDPIEGSPKGEHKNFIFLPRIITQTHPWGYKLDGGVLSLKERREAMERFNLKGKYPQYNLKDVHPTEAKMPVPMAFLIEAISNSKLNWKNDLIKLCRKHLVEINLGNSAETCYVNKLEETLKKDDICEIIKNAIIRLESTKIPVIELQKNTIEEESKGIENSSTLFVRINTSGTVLGGEELIYSMYKTAFPDTKEIVEQAGAGFIAPSRIITLISMMALMEINFNDMPQQMKLKKFKESIRNENGDFYKKLKEFTDDKSNGIKQLFQNVKEILIGEKNYQLSFPLAVDIARGNINLFFTFLYWLKKSELTADEILKNEPLHKSILASLTMFNWFALDHLKGLNILEIEAFKNGKEELRSKEVFKKIFEKNKTLISHICKPQTLQETLKDKPGKSNWDVKDVDKDHFEQFKARLFGQRGFLLFVQRSYLNSRFKELQWDVLLENTNRPYDWDHIFPADYVYKKKGIDPEVKEIYNTIGNFRAWALEDNRGDHANLPSVKLDDKNDPTKSNYKLYSFINKNDLDFWEKIGAERITTDKTKAENVCKAIYTRIGNIYEEWYNTLCVGALMEE